MQNCFLFNIAGNETPQIDEYVYYMPEFWKVISEISLGVTEQNLVCGRNWKGKVSTLEIFAPANIRSPKKSARPSIGRIKF